MGLSSQPTTARPLDEPAAVRDALKLLRDTTIEDRKQILLRVAFCVALVAFTMKDVYAIADGGEPSLRLFAVAFTCLFVSSAIYFNYFHDTIDVLKELSVRVAYRDPTYADLDVGNAYWRGRRVRWYFAGALFSIGCVSYAVGLFFLLW